MRDRISRTTDEPVDRWRKCQLSFTVPRDVVVAQHVLNVSEGGSLISGSILDSVRPTLRANETYRIRVANGRFGQYVSLTLIVENP